MKAVGGIAVPTQSRAGSLFRTFATAAVAGGISLLAQRYIGGRWGMIGAAAATGAGALFVKDPAVRAALVVGSGTAIGAQLLGRFGGTRQTAMNGGARRVL